MSTHDLELAQKLATESEEQRKALEKEANTYNYQAVDAEHATKKKLIAFQERTSFRYTNPNKVERELQRDLELHQICINTFTPEVEEHVDGLTAQIKELQEKLDPLLAHKRQANTSRLAVQTIQASIDFVKSPEGVKLSKEIKERRTAEITANERRIASKGKYNEFVNAREKELVDFLEAQKTKHDVDFQGAERVRPRNQSGRTDSTRDYFPDHDTDEEFLAKKKRAHEKYATAAEALAKKSRMA
jgi:hypothetical protein